MVKRRQKVECGDPDPEHIRRFREQILKVDAILVIPEKDLPPPGSAHYLMPSIRIFNSQWS